MGAETRPFPNMEISQTNMVKGIGQQMLIGAVEIIRSDREIHPLQTIQQAGKGLLKTIKIN